MLRNSLIFSFLFILALFIPMRSGSSVGNLDDRRANDKLDAPMEVELYFSSQPSLQQQTVLNFKVTALQDAPNTEIKIEIPQDGFRLISGIVSRVENLSKGETKIYQIVVLPILAGNYHFSATAISANGSYVFGKRAELFVQLDAAKSKISETNIFAGEPTTNSQVEKISDNSEPPLLEIPDQKSSVKQQSNAVLAPGAGQIVVRGYWFYRDKNGIDRPLRDARVEIWDLDTFSGDDLLYALRTNNSGFYESVALPNPGDEAGGQDIYVKVYSTDDISVRVTNFSSGLYVGQSSTFSNVADGYVEVGSLSLTDANNRMAFYIYDKIANDAYDYLSTTVGWQNTYNQQVRWSPTSTSGALYNHGGTIDLNAGDRWDIDVFLHEYGHFVMWKVYGNAMPSTPNCSPHSWGLHSSTGCAWVEGWATFLQAAIQNDRFFDDTENQILHIDIEPPNAVAHHAEDEGAVTASLWDVFDSSSETWDSVGLGINGTWGIVSASNRPSDFIGFYGNWMNGSNGSNPQVTSIIQHHDVIPNPVLTASLTLTPGQPYLVGQTVTGKFSITNRGNRAITFEVLTIGGRLNTDSNVVDFPLDTNITLSPNQTYQYSRSFTFQQSGSYKFFPAYRLLGNVWKIGQLSEIPKDAGVVDLLTFTVNSSCNAPGAFSLSAPSNGQSLNSTTSVNLSWGGSANADSYDVYFGTNSNPPFIANQTGTSRPVSVTPGQTYWWKVVAKVNCGSATSTAGVWSFSVQQTCNTPGAFSLSAPSNGQGLSSTTSVNLSWGGSANADSYDVYFGTSSNPPFVANQTGTSRPVSVTPGQTYWWKVVAKVNCGSGTSTTAIWSFSVQQATSSSVQFSSGTYSVNENAGSRTITVTRTGGTSAVGVSYATSNGTATAGSDYTSSSGTLSFATNETSKTFTVPIIDDASVEGDQTVNLTLSNPSGGATLGSPATAVLTIVDNDSGCNYSISSSELTVSPGSNSVKFLMDATSGCAWTAVSDSSWLTTSSSGSGDGDVNYQTAVNSSSNPRVGHITVGGQVHTVTQIGVGGAGSVQFSATIYAANEGGGDVTVTVTRTGGTGTGTVSYSTSNGSAASGSDYTPASGLLLFTGNTTSLTFNIPILEDTVSEGNETINLLLNNQSSSLSLGNPSTATVTIVDNDSTATTAPAAGRTSGGQQVILSGSFAGLSTVTMGGVSAAWFYTNGAGDTSKITITTPAHPVGAVQIDLTPTSGSPYSKSNAFAYLPTVFTDNTLLAAVTPAKAQHIIELRQAVDAMRAVAGLAPAPWTDPTLSPFSAFIKGVHIMELRTYLNDAASRLGYSTSSYTDPTLTTGFSIKRVHIEELRERIRNIGG